MVCCSGADSIRDILFLFTQVGHAKMGEYRGTKKKKKKETRRTIQGKAKIRNQKSEINHKTREKTPHSLLSQAQRPVANQTPARSQRVPHLIRQPHRNRARKASLDLRQPKPIQRSPVVETALLRVTRKVENGPLARREGR